MAQFGQVPEGNRKIEDTWDRARGGKTVKFNDALGRQHAVTLHNIGDDFIGVYPVRGGEWVWYDEDGRRRQRTGFSNTARWIRVRFDRRKGQWPVGDSTRMHVEVFEPTY